tara:strand:+ start:1820 stop:3373 length:1554 start_codon:yes stop_codon:yes gene_type:complete
MSVNKLFKASNDVSIDSERVLIPSANGNTFVEKNKIVFDIPRAHQFISLRECLLHFDIALNNNIAGCEFPEAGVQRIIKSLRVVEKTTNRTIETINNYNVLATNQYHYSLTNGEKNSRSLTELADPQPNNLSNKIISNPFLQSYVGDGSVALTVAKKDLKQRVCLKLWSKVFDNDVVWGNSFAPLQVHVELEDNLRALKVIPQLNDDDTTNAASLGVALPSGVSETQISIKDDPNKGIDHDNEMPGHPFNVGMGIKIIEAGKPTLTGTISKCDINTNLYRIEIAVAVVPGTNYTTAANVVATGTELATCTYTVTNPSIEVAVCNVPDSWKDSLIDLIDENQFRYNFKAIDNVQINQQSGATNFVNYINSNATSSSGVLTIPMNSQTADSATNDLITGQYDAYDNYNYHYNNANQPSLPVSLVKLNAQSKVSQQHLHELMKCNENFWGTKSLETFKTDFAVGRSFSVYGGAMRLNNKDLSCNWNVVSGSSLSNNVMFNNYLVNNKTLIVSKDGVSFEQ